MNSRKTSSRSPSNKIFKRVGIGLLIATVVFALFLVWLFMPGSTKELEKVAGGFEPESSWSLGEESVNPPVRACLDSECNTLYRRWSMNQIVTTESFQAALKRSGWDNFEITKECDTAASNFRGTGVLQCEAEGVIEDHSVKVYAVSSVGAEPEDSDIILNIEKLNNKGGV